MNPLVSSVVIGMIVVALTIAAGVYLYKTRANGGRCGGCRGCCPGCSGAPGNTSCHPHQD